MPRVHGLRDEPRPVRIADGPQRRQPAVAQRGSKRVHQGVVGETVGDQHHLVARHREVTPGRVIAKHHALGRDRGEFRLREERHVETEQSPLDALLLERVLRPDRHERRRGHERDGAPHPRKALSQHAAHVIVVVVVHDDATEARRTIHHVVGRVDSAQVVSRHRPPPTAPDPVAPPRGARRDDHVLRLEAKDIAGGHRVPGEHLDGAQSLELRHAPIHHAAPLGQSRERRLAHHPAAHLVPCLGERHLVTLLAEHARALEAGGPRTDHQHRVRRRRLRHAFRMPSTPPLLAHRRVLRAPDRHEPAVRRDADVAPDALADVVHTPRADLVRQERVGDRRPRRADQVEDAAPNGRDHRVGTRVAADTDHRLGRERLHEGAVALLVALLLEARRRRVVAPTADVDVPQVRVLGQHRDDVASFARALDAVGAEQLVDGEARDDAAPVTDGVLGVVDELPKKTHAVLERATVLVGAVVVPARHELHGKRQQVPRVAVDEVEAHVARADRGGAVPASHVADVGLRHGPGLHRLVARAAGDRHGARPHRHGPRVQVGRIDPRVDELDPGERSVRVHGVDHAAERGHILVGPEAPLEVRGEVAGGVDLHLLRAHHPPATFGLGATHGGERLGVPVPHAVAVGHLVEAVGRRDGADPDRLEEEGVVVHGKDGCRPRWRAAMDSAYSESC